MTARSRSLLAAALLLLSATAGAQGISLDPGFQGDGPPVGGGGDCAGGEIYDDGTVENGYSGNATLISDFQGTQQFTPLAYPGTYDTVCVCLTTIAAGGPTLDFNIEVYDDDGAGGQPGTLLGAVPVSVNTIPIFPATAFFDIDVTSLGLNIPSGNVWIGVQWNPMLFPSRFVCADESPATPLHPGFVNFNNPDMWQNTQTVFPNYRAKLIRAVPGVVGGDADLSITKAGMLNPDATIDYTLTVDNLGPDTASNVVVTDDLPACTTYVSDDCGGTNVPPWTWNIGDLPAANSLICTITVDASGCQGTVSNTASVTSDTTDPNPGNESDTAIVIVDGSEADLSITKGAVLNPDDSADYTLTVSNAGPSNATNVVVTDELPPCTTYLSDDCGGMNLPPWTWNIGNLPVNSPVMCTIMVDAAGCEGTVPNTAMVIADQPDPDPDDNSSTATLVFGSVLEIPTLGRWGLLALIGLLIALGVWRLRSA